MVTSSVDAVYDGHVGNHARFVSHDVVHFNCVWWFFLTQRFLAPSVCSIGGHEPPSRSQTYMLLGTGRLGLFVLCMLVFHGILFHAGQCGLEGGTEIGVPSLGSCVSALNGSICPAT